VRKQREADRIRPAQPAGPQAWLRHRNRLATSAGTVTFKSLLLAPPRRHGELPSWRTAFLDCCLIAGDELQVKVERPQRGQDVRP
jgi:hypothetical protein